MRRPDTHHGDEQRVRLLGRESWPGERLTACSPPPGDDRHRMFAYRSLVSHHQTRLPSPE